ncbi:DNA repair protein RecN [Anaerolinea thermophila]|uniref:DNA repair protein RecN n=3 Tax=Anaerolinea TaxID=233189 RepID=UPI0026EEB9D1|nr:DNA repair protein RecN [Anaerolinea thermophila]
MLSELRIENFAIIDRLTLSLRQGLIAFTGETGAGKSIILDAIAAVIGGKVEPAMIRAGADRALVEATFTLPGEVRAAVHEILMREDLLDDPDTILLSREIRREGRSVARVNGRAVSAGLMRELGSFLVDIHGQSEHLSLLNVREHIHLLDRFAGLQELLEDYRSEYQRLQGIRRELEKLRQIEAEAERRTDLLTYQLQEIESARLRVGEDEELRKERDRLANAENLASLAQQSLTLLDEGTPDTPALSDLAGQLVQLLHGMVRMDASQSDLLEQAQTLAELASDLSRSLQTYLDGIEFNPRRLAQVEERLDVIHKIQRKYNGSIESALAFAEKARAELETIAHATERIAELEEEETRALQELSARARTLSERRKEAAARLEKAVERELSDLSMNGARFAVDFRTDPDPEGISLPDGSRVAFDALGFDRVEFLIAPNLGEGLKPLVKIASGGETSRLMLALKNVLAQADYVPTLIFDEIDQGIGGRVGAVVGEKLWQLGRRHEVLCVTHLPQLAAYGDLHFSVRKSVHEGRTTTQVQALEEEERLTELALMLGGVNPANLTAARETRLSAQQRMQELAVKI